MPDFELVPAGNATTPAAYIVACWQCEKAFDVESSLWCSCDAKLRTLECPHCGSCFCNAPVAYKRNLWNGAPRMLREHTGRFRIPARHTALPINEATAAAASLVRTPHVLIVDDEEPMRSLVACYVEQIGYNATTVTGPEEALLMTDKLTFDVILTDALMPKMDGRELCRRLKEMHGDDLKVILMTSLYTARHFQTEAKQFFKVDEYLTKPLRYGELRDALQRVAPLPGRGHAPAARELPIQGSR
jgi:CheY-like chemotaxis protein